MISNNVYDRVSRLYKANQLNRIAEIAIELAKEKGLGKINSLADVDFYFVDKEEGTENICVVLFKGHWAIEILIQNNVEIKIDIHK